MKKALLSALLLAGLATTIISCNNGMYDADPKTNNGTVLNPLSSTSGVTIPYGYMRADLDGFQANFNGGNWADEGGGTISFSAVKIDNDQQWQSISIILTNYNGPGTYTLYPDGGGGVIEHILFDPDNISYIPLGFTTSIGNGTGTVTIEGTEDGNLRGTFSGTLYQNFDEVNTANKEVITNGKFYVGKIAGL